mmetsp:Transcript_24311/g.41834  ORF Transcript_24311/g.41834 Transcript_24311/m.41834 type:complete len:124 (-) Transcript_24311:235-606(-)
MGRADLGDWSRGLKERVASGPAVARLALLQVLAGAMRGNGHGQSLVWVHMCVSMRVVEGGGIQTHRPHPAPMACTRSEFLTACLSCRRQDGGPLNPFSSITIAQIKIKSPSPKHTAAVEIAQY